MKKIGLFVLGILIALAILIIIKSFIKTSQPIISNHEDLRDTILQQSQMATMHRDSAAFYDKASSESFSKYVSVMASDTAAWAGLRAKYRYELRSKIRASSAGHSDSLRAAKTGGF